MSAANNYSWPIHTLGDPSRPAILFLHGFLGTGADWLDIAEALSQEFYCLLPDLPGHGENHLPPNTSPGYATWAAALQRTLRQHGLARVHLAGYSLGGRVALYFALTYPQMVASLALESTNPGIADPSKRAQRAAWDDDLARLIARQGLDAFLEYWYDLPLFDSLKKYPALWHELRRQRAGHSPEQISAVLRALSPGRQPDLWPRLPEIQARTLLYTGQLDPKYSRIIQEAATQIPNSRAVTLPECGHNAHRERPRQVKLLLQRFFCRD